MEEERGADVSAAEEERGTAAHASPYKGIFGKADKFFGISAAGSNYKTEIMAGLTTFMAIVYALLVVPGMYDIDVGGVSGYHFVSFDAVYIATALGAIVGTAMMAFLAKMPLAQASGLGASVYVTGTLLGAGLGLTYANAMIFVLLDGLIFILLTVTGLRKKILKGIPDEVKTAVPVGIGFFIALTGFNSAGIVSVSNGGLAMSSFNVLSENASYFNYICAAIALFGVIAIGILSHRNVKGSILWGILGCTALFYALTGLGCIWKDGQCLDFYSQFTLSHPFGAFAAWGKESVGQVFTHGFDFSGYLAVDGQSGGTLAVLLLTSALSLCMLDMFDTIGTLYGACSKGGLLDGEGNPLRMNECMLSDSIATCAGAVFGATTVTTYVESSSGVAAGGKTGFAALVTALCFVVALFLSPVAKIIPGCATSAALIWVGVLMMSSVVKIEWTKPVEALPAFLTVAVMAFGYSISRGIGVGIISSVLCRLFTGKVKEISAVMWVISALFLLMFLFT